MECFVRLRRRIEEVECGDIVRFRSSRICFSHPIERNEFIFVFINCISEDCYWSDWWRIDSLLQEGISEYGRREVNGVGRIDAIS